MFQSQQNSYSTLDFEDQQQPQKSNQKRKKYMPRQAPKKTQDVIKIKESSTYISHLKLFTQENVPNIDLTKFDKSFYYLSMSTFDCIYQIKILNVAQRKFKNVFAMKTSMPIINSHIQFDSMMNPISLTLAYINGDIQSSPFTQLSELKMNYDTEYKAYIHKIQVSDISMRERTKKGYRYLNQLMLFEGENEYISYQLALQTICVLYRKNDKVIALNYKGELKRFTIKRIRETIETITFKYKVVCASIILYKHHEQQISKGKIHQQAKRQEKLCICFDIVEQLNPFIFDLHSVNWEYEKDMELIEKVYQNLEEKEGIYTNIAFNYKTNQVTAFSSSTNAICYFQIQPNGRNLLCYTKLKYLVKYQVNRMDCYQGLLMLTSQSSLFVFNQQQRKVIAKKQNFDQFKNGILVRINQSAIMVLINKGFMIDQNSLSKQQRKTTSIHIYDLKYLANS